MPDEISTVGSEEWYREELLGSLDSSFGEGRALQLEEEIGLTFDSTQLVLIPICIEEYLESHSLTAAESADEIFDRVKKVNGATIRHLVDAVMQSTGRSPHISIPKVPLQ